MRAISSSISASSAVMDIVSAVILNWKMDEDKVRVRIRVEVRVTV